MVTRRRVVLSGVVVVLALVLGGLFLFGGKGEQPKRVHIVLLGEDIHRIAAKYEVDWRLIRDANKNYLETKYNEVCGGLSEKHRNRSGKLGLFCNERFRNPQFNTLLPGWKLVIILSDGER